MISIYKKYIKRVIKNEISNKITKSEVRFNYFYAHLLLLAITLLIPFTIIEYYFNSMFNVCIDSVALISSTLATILLYFNRKIFSKTLQCFAIIIAVFINASTHGRHSGYEFFWSFIFFGIFMVFSFKELKHIIFWLSISIIFIIISEKTDYSLLVELNTKVNKPQFNQYATHVLCLSTSLILLTFYLSSVLITNTIAVRKLEKLILTSKRKNNKLIVINKELDAFVYKISHDLKSPLTSMLGLTSLIKLETNLENIQLYNLHFIKSLNKLNSYIKDILDISKNKRTTLLKEYINFNYIISETIDQINYLPNFQNINLIIDINEKIEFYNDTRRLKVIFNNLISNSVRYIDLSKTDNKISIEITTSKLGANIVVWDNGMGIKKEYLKKVFDIYFRGTDKSEGSGLGLYIIKETIDKMNGKIKLTSIEKEWTQFEIFLPNIV